jgi:Tol biopolymer transport system component
LEYIDGPTLAERLDRGALPVEEAMNVCLQIAAALEAAHENGVIHRDLKPANVKLTPEGGVKVLDFGLAKGMTATADSGADMANSPTVAHVTNAGVILGTAAYMSPEQARGKPVDRRTDIFSFGCVLYECLTGRQIFAGETVSDTIARILEREPDWSALPGSTPAKARNLLRRCLEKDPRKRQRDIGDARLALEEIEEARSSSMRAAQESAPHLSAAQGSRRSARIAWSVAALAVIVAVASLVSSTLFRKETSAPLMRFEVMPSPGVTLIEWPTEAVISPDGRSLLWSGIDGSGGTSLWVRDLESLESRPLPGTQGGILGFWSPDSRAVAYIDGTKLRRVPVDGGEPQAVCDATSSRGGSWGKDFMVFAGEQGPLFKVPVAGGTPTPVTSLDASRGETAHRFPHFLPDGKTFLYVALPAKSGRVAVFASDVDGREPVEIMSAVSAPVYTEPGYLLYQRGRRLLAQKFDARSLTLSGEPVLLGPAPRRPPQVGSPAVSASREGSLALMGTKDLDMVLVWLDRNGNVVETLDLEPAGYTAPEISPDGRFIALSKVVSPEESDIWVLELERMVMTRFTFGPGTSSDPIWSPDGRAIAYSTDADGPWNIYRKPFPGGGDPEPVAVGEALFKNPLSWSPDGKYLLYEQIGTGTNMDLWIAPMDGSGEPRPYLDDIPQEDNGQFSPDGRWVAYTSSETGENAVYVNSFPEPGRKYRVSVGGGRFARWGAGGTELTYQSNRSLMRVPLQTVPEFRAGTPEVMFRRDDGSRETVMSPDGERILEVRQASPAAPVGIIVVLNWVDQLPD